MKIKNPINFIQSIPLADKKLPITIVLLIAASCVMTVFLSFLAGDRTFLFCDIGNDSVNASYPFYCQASLYLHRYGFPLWSAHQGLGQAFSGLMFGDPFIWPIILQSNPASIAKTIGIMESIKCFSAIILFAGFLSCMGVGRLALLLGALSYGLSGYLILGSCWNVFSTEAVYLAILLLATERFIKYGSVWLIPIPICLLGMLQPFYYWGFGLFTLAYILIRRAEQRAEASPTQTDVLSEVRQILVFGSACSIGVLLSGIFLLSSVKLMLQSPRVGGEASYTHYLLTQPILHLASKEELLTALYRTFSTDMLGVGSGFTGWQNYLEAPVFYCGLLMLLLIPQVLVMCKKKLRILYCSVVVLAQFPLFFPWFRHAFWLFQGDYYRLLSLFITTVFILLSVRILTWLEAGKKANISVLSCTLGLLVVSLLALPSENFKPFSVPNRDITLLMPPPEYQNQLLLNHPLRNITILLLTCYALLIVVLSWLNGRTQPAIRSPIATQWIYLVKGGLLALTIFEMIWFARITLNDRPVVTKATLHQKTGYNDYTVDTLAALRSIDKTPFYRVNKDYISSPAITVSFNDAMVQDFYGSSCYTQFNQINYIHFLDVMGLLNARKEHETRWCMGLTQHPLLQLWGSTKYFLTKTPTPYRESTDAYEEVGTWGNVTAFRYRQYLPLGFTYDKFITSKFFTALPLSARDAMLLQAVVVEPEDQLTISGLAPYNPINDTNAFDLKTCVANRWQNSLKLEMFRPHHILGHIETDRSKLLFFSIPFDSGWQATINGRDAKLLKVNIGFIGLMLPPGQHKLEMKYNPPLLVPGLILSGCGMVIYFLLLVWRFRKHHEPNR